MKLIITFFLSYIPLMIILRTYFDYNTGGMLFSWYSVIGVALLYQWNKYKEKGNK